MKQHIYFRVIIAGFALMCIALLAESIELATIAECSVIISTILFIATGNKAAKTEPTNTDEYPSWVRDMYG